MGKRLLINGIAVTILQTLIHYLLMNITWLAVFRGKEEALVDNIGGDFGVVSSTIVFAMFVTITNILTAVINRNSWTWGLLGLLALLYSLAWIEDFSSWPFRAIVAILIGLVSIFINVPINARLTTRNIA